MEVTRCLLDTASFPDYLWPEAADHANYLLNRITTRRLAPKSPHEVVNFGVPDLSTLPIFGCVGYHHIPAKTRHDKSLSHRSNPCKFLGVAKEFKGFKVLDLTDNTIRVTRDFRIHLKHAEKLQQQIFTVTDTTPGSNNVFGIWPVIERDSSNLAINKSVGAGVTDQIDQNDHTDGDDDYHGDLDAYQIQSRDELTNKHENLSSSTSNQDIDQYPERTKRSVGVDSISITSLNRSHDSTSKSKPVYEGPRTSNIDNDTNNRHRLTTNSTNGNKRRKSNRTTVQPRHLTDYPYLINAIDDQDDNQAPKRAVIAIPTTYDQAINGPNKLDWIKAIKTEYDACISNETWIVEPLPNKCRALPCKWLFSVKYNADNSIDKFKARLVIQGFRQIHGLDYDETFAPVARYESLRLVIAIATINDMEIHQMDACTAFLNGVLTETIYMTQPKGHIIGDEKSACRLMKSLYGLKQASRIWYQLVHDFLTRHDYRRCHKEYCIYMNKTNDILTLIVVYVDDFTIACSSTDHLKLVKVMLASEFKMKNIGEIKYILKIEVNRDRSKKLTTMSQRKYIHDLVKRFDLTDAEPAITPESSTITLEPEVTLTPAQVHSQSFPYRQLVGALQHLVRGTRPDIANAVRTLSKFLTRYNESHWKAATRVLRS